jgi:S-adenosylmethionine:tRNA ribosyltransferase-isomerase
MVRPGKKIRIGDRIVFEPRILEGEVVQYSCQGERLIRFTCQGDWWTQLEKIGHTPLPPYILKARRDNLHTDLAHTPLEEEGDRERYQTVFARHKGSVAAPTAGLHFSQALLSELQSKGIDTACITLHIGAGTFKPVTVQNVEDHPMHTEIYSIPGETAARINQAHEEKRRIIAVGTTTVRTLETAADEEGKVTAGSGETRLLIVPGYRFKCLNALVTNFHLPRSTLLMLVCAFVGTPLIMKAYEEAVREKYRFYSYGDAMLIINQPI